MNKNNPSLSVEKPIRIYNRLWVKAYLINIFFLIILLFSLFYLILSGQKSRLINQLEKNALSSAEFFSQQIALSTFIWDKQNIEEKIEILLSNLSETNSIAYILIHSNKFKESLIFGPHKGFIREHPTQKKLFSDHAEDKKVIKTKDYLHIIQPIFHHSEFNQWSTLPDEMLTLSPLDNTTQKNLSAPSSDSQKSTFIGELHIGISYEGINKSLEESRNYFIFLSIPVFILSMIFHYVQSRLITHKLYLLSKTAQKISSGDYDVEITIDSEDEIGSLGRSFSEMVSRLLNSQRELEIRNRELQEANQLLDNVIQRIQNFNIELEQKVAERTSQLEALNLTLQKKNKELKEADETKSRFLSMMSHELRTPLNAIIGFSQLALKRVKENFLKDFFHEIKNNGEHLLTLINDLLDFSKLQAGQFELIFNNFNIIKITQEVLSSTQALLVNSPIQVKTPDLNQEIMVYGDSMRIKQILLNLVSNACKFTKNGYIQFDWGLVTPHTQLMVDFPSKFINRTLFYMIRDTGIGMSAKDQKLIFEPFKQVDSSESRIHGTGLGLTISKSLIELHNSCILFYSRENEGTAIYFFIPLNKEAMFELGKNL